MSSSRMRISAYRSFAKSSLVRTFLERKLGSDRLNESEAWRHAPLIRPGLKRHNSTIWFHASSAGELESLWPIIVEMGDKSFILVTLFSSSAENSLLKLTAEMESRGNPLLFSGFAPLEGDWQEALRKFKPNLFVTTKYEAWPELWAGLCLEKIPLLTVGAGARSSLRWGKRICEFLIAEMPRMYFSISLANTQESLQRLFPNSVIKLLGEPRWDRAASRKISSSPRATVIRDKIRMAWGEGFFPMLAQVWSKDVEQWQASLQSLNEPLLIVPHKVDSKQVRSIGDLLRKSGYRVWQSSQDPWDSLGRGMGVKGGGAPLREAVIVDELGVLMNLYSLARWVYVGGGFGEGIHSTLEPALYGLPVSAGPAKAEKFPEVDFLVQTGELTLVKSREEIQTWLKRVQSEPTNPVWKEQVQAQLGSTLHHVAWIDEILRSSC